MSDLLRHEKAKIAARLERKVRIDPTTGCWLWQAALDKNGYGFLNIRIDGKSTMFRAPRLMWTLTHGSTPSPGRNVMHSCDTPACINPAHLSLGTQAENLADARTKGRLINGLGNRKLSDDAYRDILTTPHQRGVNTLLAQKHGVSDVSISRIRNGHQGTTYHSGHAVTHRSQRDVA